MTTLTNGNRKISIEFGTTTVETKKVVTEEKIYTVTLPVISCNNEKDAIDIEMAVSKYVSNLVKDTLSKSQNGG